MVALQQIIRGSAAVVLPVAEAEALAIAQHRNSRLNTIAMWAPNVPRYACASSRTINSKFAKNDLLSHAHKVLAVN